MTKWRPRNWINRYADKRDKEIKNDKHIAFESGASAMLSARDQLWIKTIDEQFEMYDSIDAEDWELLKKMLKEKQK